MTATIIEFPSNRVAIRQLARLAADHVGPPRREATRERLLHAVEARYGQGARAELDLALKARFEALPEPSP